MKPTQTPRAIIAHDSNAAYELSGFWNVQNLQDIESEINAIQTADGANINVAKVIVTKVIINCAELKALDTAGALLLQKLLQQLKKHNTSVMLNGLSPSFKKILDSLNDASDETQNNKQNNIFQESLTVKPSFVTHVGQKTVAAFDQILEILRFIGETAVALGISLKQPKRIRWRPILFNIRTAGFDALPIVGLLSFLLGIVVAYQGADQLRQYGANIFVVDLVGLSMLREFAPLMTAIIIAGRSGSAYAAQIGTMVVTEEVDALRTLGISPQELLVLPKVIALIIAMPLLTVFADVLGVFGGMLMARQQLDVGFTEFSDRFVKAISATAFMIGVGKAPVFAAIIAMVGCYQGFRTKGGADSVGRQTTRSVVQSIFLVILADALFSIAFSALDL